MLTLAFFLALQPAPARETVVLIDDRAVKDQAPADFLSRVTDEIDKRKGMRAVRISQARKRLDARQDKALNGCGDDAGCLAAAALPAGGDVVVTVRLTKREGAFFLALTRINALRPQITDDAATLAGTVKDALGYVPEAVAELFPDAELEPESPAGQPPPAP
jgi:hypothetical protein